MFMCCILYFLSAVLAVSSKGLSCCDKAEFRICRRACIKYEKSNLRSGITSVDVLLQNCPANQVLLWGCVKAQLDKGQEKVIHEYQRNCCPLAVSDKCAVACHYPKQRDHILNFCSSTKDVELLKCVNKHEILGKCCKATQVSACRNTCHEVIMSRHSPSFKLLSSLHDNCQSSSRVLNCIERFTDYKEVTPGNSNFSACCKRGKNEKCRKMCNFAFSKNVDERELVKLLVKDCGYPFPQVGLYQCIFEMISKKAMSEKRSLQRNVQGPNIIRSQCCIRAKSTACHNWCQKVFSKLSVIGYSDPMYSQCMKNPSEYALSTCIEDVLEPCQYGCKDKMNFCSNFNNRPSELFRRCDKKADKTAKEIYNNWKDGRLTFLSFKIPLKNITECNPDMWKALACSIVIKPCSRKTNRNQICRNDCVSLLKKCLNFEKENVKSAEEMCMMLLPNSEQKDCISASRYVNSATPGFKNQVTFPCRNNPCKINEVCRINKDCSYGKRSPNCRMYTCEPGCSLSGSANIKIPNNELAKILTKKPDQCFAVCRCLARSQGTTKTHSLTNCIEFGCNHQRTCKFNQSTRDHNTRFMIGCNYCTCYDGELLCTNQTCKLGKDLPSNCKDTFNPVCGFNGITYQSICHARLVGLSNSQLKPGDCASINACAVNPCPSNMKCLVHRRVCLSSDVFCPQYDCVALPENKEKCKEDGTSNCQSQVRCESNVPVCGLDGVTYRNKCDAKRSFVPIDYVGPCAQFSNQVLDRRCSRIKCPRKENSNCKSHIPSGGCCPICEPYLRVLYSHREVHRHLRIVEPKPLIVKDVIQQLSHFLYVSECTMNGYLSKDGDIIVIIKSNLLASDGVQNAMCEREVDRIAALINERSPLLSTNYHVSIVKAAFIQYPSLSTSSNASQTMTNIPNMFIIQLALFMYGCM